MPQPTTIGGAIVAVVFIVAVYFFLRYRNGNNEENKKAADEFLQSLSDQIEKMLLEIVTKVDIKDYKTLEDLESAIFNLAYTDIWGFIEKQVKEAVDNKVISAVVGALVTRENVEAFIDILIKKVNIMQRAESQWAVAMASGCKEAENFEKEIVEKNAAYASGNVDIEKHEQTEYDVDPMKTGINPEREDEETFNAEDESMEIVPGSEEVLEDPTESIEESDEE